MTASSERFQKMILNAIREQTAAVQEQTAAINRLTEINAQMVEALADEGTGDDTPPARYLDGSPRHPDPSGTWLLQKGERVTTAEKPPPREL